MKTSWRDTTFGEIFEISSSKRVLEKQWKTTGVPFYRAREIVKLAKEGSVANELFISEDLFREFGEKYGVPKPGDLMISAVGTLGACYVVQPEDRFYYKDASVIQFSAKQPIHPSFFQHAFRTNEILDQIHSGSGSTVGTYTISRAKETRICLPPLAEQKRIAAILDAANALRTKRRESLAQLDALLQSTFLTLFGDPVTNPMGWQVCDLSLACDKISDGTHHSPPICSEGIPYITAKHLKKDGLRFYDDPWFISPKHHAEIFSRCNPEPGDVLYIKDGATTGIAAINRYDFEFSMLSSLALLKIKADVLTSEYLCEYLNNERNKLRLIGNMGGAAIKRLTLAKIKKFAIPTPPLPLQQKFAAIVDSIERQKDAQRAHLAELDALFAALQHRAFRGEL